jgi:hypothetical protein
VAKKPNKHAPIIPVPSERIMIKSETNGPLEQSAVSSDAAGERWRLWNAICPISGWRKAQLFRRG